MPFCNIRNWTFGQYLKTKVKILKKNPTKLTNTLKSTFIFKIFKYSNTHIASNTFTGLECNKDICKLIFVAFEYFTK